MIELKLLPCPFCGGEAVLETTIGRKGYDACVFCNCSASVCSATCDDVSEAEINAIAAWNRRADARQLALKTGVCPMCEDCPDGCPVETPKDSRNIVTNADRIRSMSDEELADSRVGEFKGFLPFPMWIAIDVPDKIVLSKDKATKIELDWLRQPVNEADTLKEVK